MTFSPEKVILTLLKPAQGKHDRDEPTQRQGRQEAVRIEAALVDDGIIGRSARFTTRRGLLIQLLAR